MIAQFSRSKLLYAKELAGYHAVGLLCASHNLARTASSWLRSYLGRGWQDFGAVGRCKREADAKPSHCLPLRSGRLPRQLTFGYVRQDERGVTRAR